MPRLVAHYCLSIAGRPVGETPPAFGKGLTFAFGHDNFSAQQRAADPEMVAFMEVKLHSPAVVADLLANPEGDDREKMAEQILLNGTKVAEAAEHARQGRSKISPDLFDQTLLYRIALSSHREIQAVCDQLGADARLFLTDAERIGAGITHVPPLAVEYELIRDQVMQAQRKAQPNDMVDIASMSMVIPYCDIVVTERHWAHVSKHLGLADRHATVVLTDVNQLSDHL